MTRSTRTLWVAGWLAVFSLSLVTGCGTDDDPGEHSDEHAVQQAGASGGEHGEHGAMPVGPPSGATCPPASALTYSNFGKAFFATYCLRCHSAAVTGAARMNAPADHNFDQLAMIDLLKDHIDQKAAAGPTKANEMMPPAGPKPSLEERKKLGEWLACGLKE